MSMYALYFYLTRRISSCRTEEVKERVIIAYKAILGLIPKLKKLLPIQDDADPEYFFKVVNAVSNAHTSSL